MFTVLLQYTIDPKTRYVRIEKTVDPDRDVCEQVDTDNPRLRPTSKPLTLRNAGSVHDTQTGYKHRYRLWRFCNQALMPFKLKVVNFKTNRQVHSRTKILKSCLAGEMVVPWPV